MRHCRPCSWGMVASSMWPVFWSVRLGRSVAALVIWNSFPMILLQAGSAGQVAAEKKDCPRL